MTNTLIKGDPFKPCDSDWIMQDEWLTNGELPEGYDTSNPNHGWRCIGGNHVYNQWVRVVMRYELEAEA